MSYGKIFPLGVLSASGVAGAIQFSNGSAFASDATNLFWDDTNNRLGIGTNAPTTSLSIINASGSIFNWARTSGASGAIIVTNYRSGAGQGTVFNINEFSFRNTSAENYIVSELNRLGVGTNNDALTARMTIKGSGSTSATTSLLVQNSSSSTLLQVRDDGLITLPGNTGLNFSGANAQIFNNGGSGGTVTFAMGGATYFRVFQPKNADSGITSGEINTITTPIDYGWSSGSASPNLLSLSPSINNTGAYSGGTFRGIYYNPTITSLVGTNHIAIQTVTGNVILGSTSGNVGIGTSSPTSKLYLDGGVFTKKYYTDISNNTINFGSAYELFGTPHSSSGYSFFINPSGFSSGWDFNIGNATTYFSFNASHGFSAFKVSTSALNLGGGQLSYYLSSPDTGWSYASAGGWDFVIRGSADEKLRIKSGGNVLIGTTTDAGFKLNVNGTGRVTTLSVGDGVNNQGTIYAGQIDLNYPNFLRYQSLYYFTIEPKDNSGNSVTTGGYVAIKADTIQLLHDNYFFLSIATTTNGLDTVKLKRGITAGHIPMYIAIEGSDAVPGYNYGTRSGSILIYPGEQSFGNGYGNVILGHSGTAARGSVIVGGTTINDSAVLNVQSTTKGFLPPRMTNAQRGLITTPAVGLMVYCTDAVEGIYVYKSTGWTFVA